MHRTSKPLICLALFIIAAGAEPIDPRLSHLRSGSGREWDDFPEESPGARRQWAFESHPNAGEQTIRWRQRDVKQGWTWTLNGRKLGELVRDENAQQGCVAIPAGTLREGNNELVVESTAKESDDIEIGDLSIDPRPLREALGEGRLHVTVRDRGDQKPLPCRITLLDDRGMLALIGSRSDETRAVRTGVAYLAAGETVLEVPAGKYRVVAGRGFEYGIDSAEVEVRAGQTADVRLQIAREVPTPGWVACDTHVHTLTYSGHGDCTDVERVITLAGEGIEWPIITDHNRHIDLDPLARRLNLRQWFTPVVGNEFTTKVGHFNIFPVEPQIPPADTQVQDWADVATALKGSAPRVVILNHPRDLHAGFLPFAPEHHLALTGDNLDGWKLPANAMELVNSGAQQSDMRRTIRDWHGMLNHGHVLTPVGSSDSHDVSRYIVGQGRTYIRCDDADAGNIDIDGAVRSFVEGRTSVSLGLLADISVNGTARVGDIVTATGPIKVQVRVLGPAWTTAERVEVYANGVLVALAEIPEEAGRKAGEKWTVRRVLERPKHDVHLTAVAWGAPQTGLFWPLGKPYQPTSTHVDLHVVGITGAVWIDADGDGQITSARGYAEREMKHSKGELQRLCAALERYDLPTAAQAAALLQKLGVDLEAEEAANIWRKAAPVVANGFREYLDEWRQSVRARQTLLPKP
ncbi:MAG TPA: CehA/McbA family metallohydrolase [Planctomycetaceae bacterium]|nr:CehA/McbA family metallohydrolase [Planctomycetaceae bacterium]